MNIDDVMKSAATASESPAGSSGEPGQKSGSPPEALKVALEQIHEQLNESGRTQLKNLIEARPSGYAQLVAVLEKLSKCALDWREYRDRRARTAGADTGFGQLPGFSKQTEEQLVIGLEGPIKQDKL